MQHHKNVLLVSKTSRLHERMRELSHSLDISVLLSTPDTFDQAISSGHDFDLVLLDLAGLSSETINKVDAYVAGNSGIPRLFSVDEEQLPSLRMPVQGRSDLILATASEAEFEVRLALLLWPGEETVPSDFVTIDNMTINLATYQVTIDGEPVDLTLMEYSLLSFLATHPSRAYSREALLHRVWGFEYCGGTRTVDVHIRRCFREGADGLRQALGGADRLFSSPYLKRYRVAGYHTPRRATSPPRPTAPVERKAHQ